jgi:pimeloyl-[acyl-carrier protein] methyl ester esterase
VTYVGWSMGGAIGQVFGATRGDLIERLVLVDTTPQLLAGPDFAHALPPAAAADLGGLLMSDWDAGCAAFCGLVAPEDAEVAAELTGIARAARVDVSMAAFASAGARNQLAELGRIEVPTHVICGAADAVCPPAASAYLADAIPGCLDGARMIEGAGHAPFLTRPEPFDSALRQALAG